MSAISGVSNGSPPALPAVVTNDNDDKCSSISWKATYSSYLSLWKSVLEVWGSYGLKLSSLRRKTSDVFSAEDAFDTFGVTMFNPGDDAKNAHPFPRRVRFQCTKKGCPFNIPASWIKKQKCYVITAQSNTLCLEHNHQVTFTGLDGCVEINNEKDLTAEEIDAIELQALSFSEMAKIKESLSYKFPKRDFTTKLIRRVMDKKRDITWGKDRDQVPETMAYGNAVARDGGVWLPLICHDTMRFIGCHFQTKRMRLYAIQYGTYYTSCDGTHHTNKYKLINCPWVSPDCLGHNHIIGIGLFRFENSNDITVGARAFGIASSPDESITDQENHIDSHHEIDVDGEDVDGEEGSSQQHIDDIPISSGEEGATVEVSRNVNLGDVPIHGGGQEVGGATNEQSGHIGDIPIHGGGQEDDVMTIGHNSAILTSPTIQVSGDVEGIPLENPVAKNSYGGVLAADEASWGPKTAEAINKRLSVCTHHKSGDIVKSGAGLGGLRNQYFLDMNSLIYTAFASARILDDKINAARRKYGHDSRARKFIDSINNIKTTLCATYMQYEFTWGKSTTQGGEGTNDLIKGHASLKAYLLNANIHTLLKRLNRLERIQSTEAIKKLEKLRELGRRWSGYYQKLLDKSKLESSTEIISCVPANIDGDDGSPGRDNLWTVTHKSGKVVQVNLATKVVHLGHIYTIPTCPCGNFCSHLVMCSCLIRALTCAGREVEDVYNIHPIHLLELHPMWPEALKKCNMVGYSDFDHLAHLNHQAEQSTQFNNAAIPKFLVRPEKYWNKFEREPDSKKAMIGTIREQFRHLESIMENGDESTLRIIHCRLKQAVDEGKGNIDEDVRAYFCMRAAQKPKGRTRKSDMINHSPLNFGRNDNNNKKKAKRPRLQANGDLLFEIKNGELSELCKACAKPYSGKKDLLVSRLENEFAVSELRYCDAVELEERCRSKNLPQSGTRFDMVLCLLQNHYGTTTNAASSFAHNMAVPTLGATVDPTIVPTVGAPTLPTAAGLPTLPASQPQYTSEQIVNAFLQYQSGLASQASGQEGEQEM